MEEYRGMGLAGVKLKIGGRSPEEDLERLATVREAMGEGFVVACDANQGYTVEEAVAFAQSARQYDVEWFEEPVAWYDQHEGMRTVRQRTGVPVAAGQSESTPSACRRLVDGGSVDVLNLDSSLAGGPTSWLKVARMAELDGVEMAHHEEPTSRCTSSLRCRTAATRRCSIPTSTRSGTSSSPSPPSSRTAASASPTAPGWASSTTRGSSPSTPSTSIDSDCRLPAERDDAADARVPPLDPDPVGLREFGEPLGDRHCVLAPPRRGATPCRGAAGRPEVEGVELDRFGPVVDRQTGTTPSRNASSGKPMRSRFPFPLLDVSAARSRMSSPSPAPFPSR
jgi:hypothetical protein